MLPYLGFCSVVAWVANTPDEILGAGLGDIHDVDAKSSHEQERQIGAWGTPSQARQAGRFDKA